VDGGRDDVSLEDATDLTYTDEAFPHGLKCIDCDHLFIDGERYSRRLVGMAEFAGEPANVCELVCVPCALSGAVTA
jgi:hypothetical protein